VCHSVKPFNKQLDTAQQTNLGDPPPNKTAPPGKAPTKLSPASFQRDLADMHPPPPPQPAAAMETAWGEGGGASAGKTVVAATTEWYQLFGDERGLNGAGQAARAARPKPPFPADVGIFSFQ